MTGATRRSIRETLIAPMLAGFSFGSTWRDSGRMRIVTISVTTWAGASKSGTVKP